MKAGQKFSVLQAVPRFVYQATLIKLTGSDTFLTAVFSLSRELVEEEEAAVVSRRQRLCLEQLFV